MIQKCLSIKYLLFILLFFVPFVQAADHPTVNLRIPADSVQMVYLANVNANYENCHCGEHPLGGLDRVVTVVKRWRRENPRLLLFDGGDFLNAYPYPSLNGMILKLYGLLQPKFVCLGDQELQTGNLKFQEKIFNSGIPVLGTNLFVGAFSLNRQIRIKLKNHRIRIFSYLDSSAFLWEKPARNVKLSDKTFDLIYRQSLNQNDFRIAIFHGERDRVNRFVKRYPEIRLLLLAHSQTKEINRSTFPWILGIGTDSEYVTRISLIFSGKNKTPELKIKTVPIELSIRPDDEARKIIDAFKNQQK